MTPWPHVDTIKGAAETMIEMLEDDLRRAVPSLSSIYIRPEKHENAATAAPQATL